MYILCFQIANCVSTLQKYFDNIINNPDDEKYRKIKLSNRVFQEKVATLEGTTEFLEAAGFHKQKLTINECEEEYFVFSEMSEEALENLKASNIC